MTRAILLLKVGQFNSFTMYQIWEEVHIRKMTRAILLLKVKQFKSFTMYQIWEEVHIREDDKGNTVVKG